MSTTGFARRSTVAAGGRHPRSSVGIRARQRSSRPMACLAYPRAVAIKHRRIQGAEGSAHGLLSGQWLSRWRCQNGSQSPLRLAVSDAWGVTGLLSRWSTELTVHPPAHATRTCCAMPAASRLPKPATTLARSRNGSATATSSTPPLHRSHHPPLQGLLATGGLKAAATCRRPAPWRPGCLRAGVPGAPTIRTRSGA